MTPHEALDITRQLRKITAELDALANRIQLDEPAVTPWGRCSASVISTSSLRDRLKSATEVLSNIAAALGSCGAAVGTRDIAARFSRPPQRR